MARFSAAFGISKSQAELDFVDVDLSTDTPVYVCPYAIQIRDDEWSNICGDHIRSFFGEVLDQLRADNAARVEHLMSHLHEPNETHLGESRGRPRGRGVGTDKANWLGEALRNSRAFETGVISDISEAALFIRRVGRDTISDLTTNILRGPLANYTREQCELYDIATCETRSLGPAWNPASRDWEAKVFTLPTHDGRPIVLVPKFSVRRNMSLDSQEFYNFHMVEYLQSEYLRSSSALVETLKNGTQRVTKKSVKEIHPFIKDDIAVFVQSHPDVLDLYKSIKGAKGPIESNDLETGFDEAVYAQALIDSIGNIEPGHKNATRYHDFVMGVCTFLFYPDLITPIKEFEQHNGRKRIDIKFTNASTDGFFYRMLESPQTRSISIPFECKNYSKDIGNEEADQLSGRFGHQRGFFGVLLCRSLPNRERVVAECRDTAGDGRGFKLVFEDSDLQTMLGFVRDGRRRSIDRFLSERFDEITH